MSKKERGILVVILLSIATLVIVDLAGDAGEGAAFGHLFVESTIAFVALLGVFYILRDSFRVKQSLENEKKEFSNFRKEAEAWRAQSKKYIDGLSIAIDEQLSRWNLTAAEKDVAFLLLKGLSLKEISNVRQTSEKTARAQSLAIYSKSGLSGRSELAAFFLEDLLAPGKV